MILMTNVKCTVFGAFLAQSHSQEVTMFGLGLPELIVVFIIAFLIFGPSKLPSLGKSIGEAIKGFKKGLEEDLPKEIIERDAGR